MDNKETYYKNQIGLLEKDLAKIYQVFSAFSAVEKVWLYGSRAKGNHQVYSDIDLVLDGQSLDLKTQHQIEWALDDLYLPYHFDVSLLSQIENSELRQHIDRVGILFYERG